MTVLDRNLVRAINSGRSFAMIGSGPSCDIGMPSWRGLADRMVSLLADQTDIKKAQELICAKEYAKVFGLAAKAIGIEPVLTEVQHSLSGDWPTGQLYEYIVSWPFQSYLTTNFDGQILRHLKAREPSAVERLNTVDDMSVLHSTSANVIFKIHGDLSNPNNIVLTNNQYSDFQHSPKREYWRETLYILLRAVDFVAIGYSASDPDFAEQLERAMKIASPDHPVYMFVSDVDQNTVDKYFLEKNIRMLPYDNRTGNHVGLKKLLARYDPFIAKRSSSNVGLPIADPNAVLASSLHLFTATRLSDPADTCITRSSAALLLQVLSTFPALQPIKISQLIDTYKTKIFAASGVDPIAIQAGIDHLYARGLINTFLPDEVALHSNGITLLNRVAAQRKLVEEQFDSSCRSFLNSQYSTLSDTTNTNIIKQIKDGLIKAFETRGMEIARSVFSNLGMDISDAMDILDVVNRYGEVLATLDERAAFADLMIEVLLKSTLTIKQYLGVLSQGYFAYHALALDQNCSDERLKLARSKTWILDSNVILALLAISSLNHDYACDLLRRMRELSLCFATTEKLLSEVQDHAYWAIVNFAHEKADSTRLLLAAEADSGYKQNLFIDGFAKWSLGQSTPRVDSYLTESLGDNYNTDLREAIKTKIKSLGIDIKQFHDWPGFTESLYAERDSLSGQIAEYRKGFKTYTCQDQCDAEAEIVIITRLIDAVFLSQSSFLNHYSNTRIIWKPEAMFRFLTLFSSTPPENDMLYQCMTQDFFYAGFDIIDEQTITKFASPLVRQARAKLEKERGEYEQVLGEVRVAELTNRFEQTPDSQKPFYSMQFAFYVANQAEELRKAAVQRAIVAESTSQLTQKEKREYERLKAKQTERKNKAKKKSRRKRGQSKKH